jgi:hypothetical protein
MRKATSAASTAQEAGGPGAVADPAHARTHLAREPGDPAIVWGKSRPRPHREVQGRTPMVHGGGKSDTSIVPEKPPNNAGRPAAEAVEGRAVAKGNLFVAGHAPDTEPGARDAPARAGARCWGAESFLLPMHRHYPRQEPDEVAPHVRICAGGAERSASLPRLCKSTQKCRERESTAQRDSVMSQPVTNLLGRTPFASFVAAGQGGFLPCKKGRKAPT